MVENGKAPFWKPALIYGAILGVVSILLSVVFYILNLQFKSWAGIISFLVSIAVLVYCLRAYRDEYLGGFATYGKLLLMTLAIAVVASILSMIYTYVLINYIDVDYIEKLKLVQIEKLSENPRLTDSQVDMFAERIENRVSANKTIVTALIGGVIFTFIIGLIASAFIKKEETPASNIA